jgi:transposase
MKMTAIGLDLAKRVSHVHAVNGAGEAALRKTLRREQMLGFFAKLDRFARSRQTKRRARSS